jgi:hypothetical protein
MARPYERRSRMQMFYLVAGLVIGAAAVVGTGLWLLNRLPHR